MYWKDKKVVVTGAGGFIGSHLTERLVELNARVKAFVRYNSKNDWGNLELLDSHINGKIEVVSGNVTDPFIVREAVSGCDVVFHLAALIGIPYSYIAPKSYVDTNIIGTLNVMQACYEEGVANIIHTSTSETYGTAQYVPIDEKHPLIGQSPYSATKIGADELAMSYYYSFDMPVKIVRPFNTYGPRQSARAIIPTIITQILNGEKEIKLGNLDTTRDLVFVSDTVDGFIEIANSDKLNGEITNIGMNEEISVRDLVKLISKLMGKDVIIIRDPKRIRPSKSEVERLCCNNKKIIENTNWMPKYTLKSGLEITIKWIQDNMDKYKVAIYNV